MQGSKSLLVLILFIVGISQVRAAQDLQAYYSNVEDAQQMLVEYHWSEAADCYAKVFEYKDFAFKCDLTAALFCEIKSGKPHKERTINYSQQLKRFGVFPEKYYSKFDNYDATLFFLDTIPLYGIREVNDAIEKLLVRDQSNRKLLTKMNDSDSLRRTFNVCDSLNIIDFKELLSKYNLFDVRSTSAIAHSDMSTLFNHWSITFPEEYTQLLATMLDAVHRGVMDARVYAHHFDMQFVRRNFHENLTPYGSHLFSNLIACQSVQTSYYDCQWQNFYAYSVFDDSNPEHQLWLSQTDANRKEIYLGTTISNAIRRYKLERLGLKFKTNFASDSLWISNVTKEETISFLEELKKTIANPYILIPDDIDISEAHIMLRSFI